MGNQNRCIVCGWKMDIGKLYFRKTQFHAVPFYYCQKCGVLIPTSHNNFLPVGIQFDDQQQVYTLDLNRIHWAVECKAVKFIQSGLSAKDQLIRQITDAYLL